MDTEKGKVTRGAIEASSRGAPLKGEPKALALGLTHTSDSKLETKILRPELCVLLLGPFTSGVESFPLKALEAVLFPQSSPCADAMQHGWVFRGVC